MAIDPSIPLKVQMPNIAGIYQDAMQARQQNELAMQQQRAQAADLQQKNALARVYTNSFNPETGEVNRNMLLKGLAYEGRGDLIPTLQTEFAQQDKALNESKIKKLELDLTNTRNAREEIARAMGKSDAIEVARRFVSQGALDPETASAIVQTIPDDPNGFKNWQRNFSMQLLSAEKRMDAEYREQQLAIQRGQLGVSQGNLQLSRQRFYADQNRPRAAAAGAGAPGAPPAAIKPLTAAQEVKLRRDMAKDYTATQTIINNALDPKAGVVGAINAVRGLSQTQKERATGFDAYIPPISTKGKQAATALKNLEGKVTEMGKAAAAATGAIGSMAVQEWTILRDMIAGLDFTKMSAADLENQLDIIEAQSRKTAETISRAYEDQYMEEFDRYPGRFQLKMPGAASAAPATDDGVDKNNPYLR